MNHSRLLQGLRRYLDDPELELRDITREPFVGGLSGSTFEYWHCQLQNASRPIVTVIYKRGRVVTGALLRGAPQREVQAYTQIRPLLPLQMPRCIAGDAETGDLWLEPFPAGKRTTHWEAEGWTAADVRGCIADLASLHAHFFCTCRSRQEGSSHPLEWEWLADPIGRDAEGLMADARASLEVIRAQRLVYPGLTNGRLFTLQQLAEEPEPLLNSLRRLPATLCHGDPGFYNVWISEDGRRLWYDWQLVARGPAALDWLVFIHPWTRMSEPPLGVAAMTEHYLEELARHLPVDQVPDPAIWAHAVDAAAIWRWLSQWAPLAGLYHQRLPADNARRLGEIWQRLHFPALDRVVARNA